MTKTLKVDIGTLPDPYGTPVLDYCRNLISEGIPPKTKLEVYRDGEIALYVNNVGKAAKLTVAANKSGTPVFRSRFKEVSEAATEL